MSVLAVLHNISAVHPFMREGRIEATVEQYGSQFAIFGIEFALEMIAGNAQMTDRTTAVKLQRQRIWISSVSLQIRNLCKDYATPYCAIWTCRSLRGKFMALSAKMAGKSTCSTFSAA